MVVEARLGQDHSWHACNPLPRGQQFFMEDTESSCAQICDFVNSVLAGSFYWAFDGLVEARCLDTNRCSRTQLLLACKQILKDDVKREQYDYAVAHPDQVRWLLLPFSVPSCWHMIQCLVGVLPLQEIDCVRIGRLCELPQWAIFNHER